MNHEFLFAEKSFLKPVITSVNDVAGDKSRSAFKTDSSSAHSDRKDFAEFLSANKRSQENKDSKQTQSKENHSAHEADQATVNRFATRVTKDGNNANALDAQHELGVLNLANISALQEEIQKIIAQQETSGREEQLSTTEQITLDGAGLTEGDKKTESLFALISSFLNESEDPHAQALHKDDEITDIAELLGKIQSAIENGDIPSLTSGLTIEQLSALDDNLNAYIEGKLSEKEEELLEALAAQWVTLTPPNTKDNAKSSIDEAAMKATALPTIQPNSDADSAKQGNTDNRHYAQARYDNRYSEGRNNSDATAESKGHDTEFSSMMKTGTEQSAATGNTQNLGAATDSAAQRFLQSSSALMNALPAMDGMPENAQALGLSQASGQNVLQNTLTSVVTQSQNATQAHPATQLVSATIQKAVKAGEDTNIKLRLDPPELGRVEVKMSIDKDNTAKIVLTAEKPETFMMLQKDSDVLQRALAESGVDTQGDISFELASDNHDFGRDGQHRDGNSSTNGGRSGADDETIIETSMDWHVDPETGHMRYNILV